MLAISKIQTTFLTNQLVKKSWRTCRKTHQLAVNVYKSIFINQVPVKLVTDCMDMVDSKVRKGSVKQRSVLLMSSTTPIYMNQVIMSRGKISSRTGRSTRFAYFRAPTRQWRRMSIPESVPLAQIRGDSREFL